MTREEAKSKASIRIQFFDAKGANKIIDQIFNDHEAQLKAKDEEIKELGEIVQQYLIPSKNYDAIIKAKDDEIELLKFIVEESIKKPMGVEPHSWSDYKMLKDNTCTS